MSYLRLQWKSRADCIASPKAGHPRKYILVIPSTFSVPSLPHVGPADFTINNDNRKQPEGAELEVTWPTQVAKNKELIWAKQGSW